MLNITKAVSGYTYTFMYQMSIHDIKIGMLGHTCISTA